MLQKPNVCYNLLKAGGSRISNMAFPAIISPKTCPPKLSTKNFPPNILHLSTHSLDIWDSHSCRWSRFFNTLQFCLLWPSPLLPANWHVKYMTTCSRLQSIDCCYYEGLGQMPASKYLFVFLTIFPEVQVTALKISFTFEVNSVD